MHQHYEVSWRANRKHRHGRFQLSTGVPLGPRGTSMMSVTFRKNIDPCCGTEVWIAPDSTYCTCTGYTTDITLSRTRNRPAFPLLRSAGHHSSSRPKKGCLLEQREHAAQRAVQHSRARGGAVARPQPLASSDEPQTRTSTRTEASDAAPVRCTRHAPLLLRADFISLQQLCVFRLHQTRSDASHERPES